MARLLRPTELRNLEKLMILTHSGVRRYGQYIVGKMANIQNVVTLGHHTDLF